MGVQSGYIGPAEIGPAGAPENPQILVASGTTVVFAVSSGGVDTITAAAGVFSAAAAGDLVAVAGASNDANNGNLTITAVSTDGSELTVSNTLANETSSAVTITLLP